MIDDLAASITNYNGFVLSWSTPDGGFECESKLAIIEVKNTKCDDFLIRQIYYPYRLWQKKISKNIVPIFMTYSNGVFSFFIFKFENYKDYNSIKLVEQRDYVIAPEPINIEDIHLILKKIKIKREPTIPFPQADKLSRVVDLLGLLVENDLSNEDITSNYDFDKRQTNYYSDAGRYLGLIEKYKDEEKIIRFKLTDKGHKIMSLPHKKKNLELIKSVLEHKPFKESLKQYFKDSKAPTIDNVVTFMKDTKLYKVNSDSTYKRRAQTILKWVEWIIDSIDE